MITCVIIIQIDRKLLWKAWSTSTVNVTLVSAPMNILVYAMGQKMGCSVLPGDFPSGWRILRDIACTLVIQDVAFYYAHRCDSH